MCWAPQSKSFHPNYTSITPSIPFLWCITSISEMARKKYILLIRLVVTHMAFIWVEYLWKIRVKLWYTLSNKSNRGCPVIGLHTSKDSTCFKIMETSAIWMPILIISHFSNILERKWHHQNLRVLWINIKR